MFIVVSGLEVTSPCGFPGFPEQLIEEIDFCTFSHVCFASFVKN